METGKNGRSTRKSSEAIRPVPRVWGAKRSTNALSWVDVNARIVTAALAAVAAADGALMLGSAQGGRGVTLTLFLAGDRSKSYAGTVAELEELLLELIDELSSPAENLRALFQLDA